jgi:acetolactate synthase-1/2/3 large subunit
MKLSDYVFHFLEGKGVKRVFVLTGGGAMHLDDSLGRSERIAYTCFLHEQALAIAAEASGQFANFPGVGLVTSGPGATNTVTAVTAAYFDSTPVFMLSGQCKRQDLKGDSGVRQMGSQEVDIVSMVSGVTKYAVTVIEPATIRFHLEKAWHLATTGRMGPVWLDIPLDVQAAAIDEASLEGFVPEGDAKHSPPAALVAEVAALLATAKRPLVLAGNGIKLAGAEADFRRFIESLGIPAVLTWKAVDFLDYSHPLNFGSPGIIGCRTANFLVQNCDLLLVIGSRLEPSITAFNSAGFAPHARLVMVDIDESEIRKTRRADVPVVADAGEFLRALVACSPHAPKDLSRWLAYARDLKVRYPVVLEEYRKPGENIDLYVFTDALSDQLAPDDAITPESSGAAGEIIYQAIRVKDGQKIKNAAGLGSMGFGLPYAIGACLATGKRTILINGDGAFQLNIQELQTLARLGLPVKMFILDNDGYASIRATQRNLFGGFYVGSGTGSGLTMPDIAAVAQAYRIRTERAETYEDLAGAIGRTLAGSDPALCVIRVSQVQVTAPRVQSMKTPEGSMISKPLEDMWPYLPPEELRKNMIAMDKG